MNAINYTTELQKLTQNALQHLTPIEVVGALEFIKGDVRDSAKARALANAARTAKAILEVHQPVPSRAE